MPAVPFDAGGGSVSFRNSLQFDSVAAAKGLLGSAVSTPLMTLLKRARGLPPRALLPFPYTLSQSYSRRLPALG